MDNKCDYFGKCELFSKYENGLEERDKHELHYFLSICLKKGNENCIKEQKSLDKKLDN